MYRLAFQHHITRVHRVTLSLFNGAVRTSSVKRICWRTLQLISQELLWTEVAFLPIATLVLILSVVTLVFCPHNCMLLDEVNFGHHKLRCLRMNLRRLSATFDLWAEICKPRKTRNKIYILIRFQLN